MKHGLALTRQAISQHLDVLESAGLVTHPAGGRCKFHYLDTGPLKAIADRWPTRGRRRPSDEDPSDERLRGRPGQGAGFYTEVLGFVKKVEVPLGEFRWLTVVSPEEPDGTQLVLEPDAPPGGRPVQAGPGGGRHPLHLVRRRRRPGEYERLRAAGVRFTQEPTDMGPVTTAVFDDTCGNLIQIASQ